MKNDLQKLVPASEVDPYRIPVRKDESGWRGPCQLLDVAKNDNTAIVKHQSVPYIVPLRHVRPHTWVAYYERFYICRRTNDIVCR